MEKLDKNYIIGFILLFLMYGSYMYFMPEPAAEQKTELAKSVQNIKVDENKINNSAVSSASPSGDFAALSTGTEVQLVIDNKDVSYTFSNKGAILKKVSLKNYKTYDDYNQNKDVPLVLIDNQNSKFDFVIETSAGKINLSDLYFETSSLSKTVDAKNNEVVTFTAKLGEGKSIQQVYTIKPQGFELDYDVKFVGLENTIQAKPATIVWQNNLKILENNITENRKVAQINYIDSEDEFSDVGYGTDQSAEENAELPIKWFSFKQKYFVSGLVSKNGNFEGAKFVLNTPSDSSCVKKGLVTLSVPASTLTSNKTNLKFYFGPNDIKELQNVAEGFNKNVYLGYDLVKPINRFVFVPIFNWFEKFITNYGLLIIVVVLAIKLLLTPLIYKSYVSSAKMRVLAPEINEIKERVGDDSVKVQQETMKLYQQVGVSPLSGCVPLLLQMPILMSVFFLFPNMIMFRQQSFLWAKDLSTYDAPISWSMNLPIIGTHISMFVVLMTISSLAFTYYNNQITPAQPGPIDMKKISYIFPLVFFFVLNSFPAALSFYYLVSNVVTIGQQLIVRKFIDEDKIKMILQENKKNYGSKPQKRNKFSDYLQKQMQSSEEMKKKSDELKKNKKK